jgi:hypothetical protein
MVGRVGDNVVKVWRSALAVGVLIALFGGGSPPVAADPEPVAAPAAAPLAPAAIGDPSTLVAVAPLRIATPALPSAVCRARSQAIHHRHPGESVPGGAGGVPAGATSVVLNVTAVDPQTTGYFTVFPTGTNSTRCLESELRGGQDGGQPRDRSDRYRRQSEPLQLGGTAHVLFDVTGYFRRRYGGGAVLSVRAGARVRQPAPVRASNGVVAPIGQAGVLNLTLRSELPSTSHYAAVLVNITATRSTAGGYLTVYPTATSCRHRRISISKPAKLSPTR